MQEHEGYAAEVHKEAGRFLASEVLKRRKKGELVVIPKLRRKVAPTAAEASAAADAFLADVARDRRARNSEFLDQVMEHPVSDQMIIEEAEPAEAPFDEDEDETEKAA